MIKNVIDYLEDQDHPLLGPTRKGLQLNGMLQNREGMRRYLHNLVHFAATLFVLSQYVELWTIRADLDSALRNLSITMLSTVCVVKAWTFVIWHTSWKEIMSAVSQKELHQLEKKDSNTSNVINEYINYSRRVTYFYWGLVTATVFTVILAPLAIFLSSTEYREKIKNGSEAHPEIMSSWVPFNKTESYGYWAYVLLHAMICFYGGGIVAAYDSNAVVLMSFFAGQLKLLKLDCERMFDQDISDVEAWIKIREYHHQHLFLVNTPSFLAAVWAVDSIKLPKLRLGKSFIPRSSKWSNTFRYSRVMNSMLSPVMFLYIIICSLMICASAVQLTKEGTTRMQQIWIMEYFMALIAQLFVYCWHGNEVLFMSNKVEDGVYESEWWQRNVRLRRMVLLLGGQMRRSFVFNAGPFTTLTVQTFVTILKGSYSYYAILSKNGD